MQDVTEPEAVISGLSERNYTKYFDLADRGPPLRHFQAISRKSYCGVLAHVNWLVVLIDRYTIKSIDVALCAELIFRVGTCLWEREQPHLAKLYFDFGLGMDGIRDQGAIAGQAYRLLGHALVLRSKKEGGLETPAVADVYYSIASVYTEIGDTATAFTMTCLRAGQPDDAQAARTESLALQEMNPWSLKSPSGTHSGDIMLLARILRSQGKHAEARQLPRRTIIMRRSLFERLTERGGLRLADSLFTVADSMSTFARTFDENLGLLIKAADHLKEVIKISSGNPGMKGHLVRALWVLAGIEERIKKKRLSRLSAGQKNPPIRIFHLEFNIEFPTNPNELRRRARAARNSIPQREWSGEDTDEGFMPLVSWMTW
ncbi:hypothetical protein QBC38DRAFT_540134 [Podospora fimiseda]|uniref:Uncharacterized protein n=1 Tax=Podospora fimiseda TaxID=252190 RepID=A0AAN6YLR5_9PEZI|nr:hypothetical protein QBC38DRAFT_540134 [Podospora fimiseda]